MILVPLIVSYSLTRQATVQPQAPPIRAESRIATIRIEKNIEFGHEAGESQLLDLYAPVDDKTLIHPGIVFVHGGGWSGGDKSEFVDKAKEMAGRGYVAISVNYRLAPKHRYPAAIQDVQQSVRWLKSHAAELRVDPERIGSVGTSAGGHLASILGVRDDIDKAAEAKPGEPNSRVRCVVDYFGRMDLNIDPTSANHTDYRPAFIGKPKAEAGDLYTEASPVTYVDSRTAPFLILQGSKDPQVEPVQSFRMFAALEKAGIEADLVMLANEGHGFKGAAARQAWDTAKAFLDRILMR